MARSFEPVSRAFLAEAAPRGCARALDLGCGPGFTTRLLREVCAPRELVGLDASEAFVARARAAAPSGVVHLVHDVTRTPFPGAPADLIYARLLLAHLAGPEALIERWRGALRPGGRLLLDEVEWIRTQDRAFLRYLDLVTASLRARGQELYVGPHIEAATRGPAQRLSRLRELPLPAATAAAMFSPNLAQLRSQPAVRERASEAELDALAAALRERERGSGSEDGVTWCMRQVAIEA